MKIIKEGIPQEPGKKWWEGKTISCPICGAQAVLEENDHPDECREQRPGGRRFIIEECPTDYCEGTMELTDVWVSAGRQPEPHGDVDQEALEASMAKGSPHPGPFPGRP